MCSASVFACKEFHLCPAVAPANNEMWFKLRKPVMTSAEQGGVSFLMKKKQCFTLWLQPCFGHSVLFQEKSLYIAHGYSHPISLAGLEAGTRILHFLLQFRAVHCLMCFVRNSQDPDLTAQIRMLVSHLHSLISFKGKKKYMINFRCMFFILCSFKVELRWKTLFLYCHIRESLTTVTLKPGKNI